MAHWPGNQWPANYWPANDWDTAIVTVNYAQWPANDWPGAYWAANHWYSQVISTANTVSYWVGGAGNWSDSAHHWAATSGGAPGTNNAPGVLTAVVFDGSSGTGVVAVDVGVSVASLNTTGTALSFAISNNLLVAGTMTVGSGVAVQNNFAATVAGFAGAGTWTQGNNSSLTYGGATLPLTLVATAPGNTVACIAGASTTIQANTYYNLIVDNFGGTATLAGNINVLNNYNQSYATSSVNAGSHTITVGGDFSADGTVRPTGYASATLAMTGNGAIAYANAFVSSSGFGSLTVGQAGNTTTLASNVYVQGILTVGSGILASNVASAYLNYSSSGPTDYPLAIDPAGVLTCDIVLCGTAVSLPSAPNGYPTLIAGGTAQTVTQEGDLLVNASLLINGNGNNAAAIDWVANGYAVVVSGNLTIGTGADTSLKKLDASDVSGRISAIQIGGTLTYGQTTAPVPSQLIADPGAVALLVKTEWFQAAVQAGLTAMAAALAGNQAVAPENLGYAALAAVMLDGDTTTATSYLNLIFEYQNPTTGAIPATIQGSQVTWASDNNQAVFTAQSIAPLFCAYGNLLPSYAAPLNLLLRNLLANVPPTSYTNIHLMHAVDIILLGQYLDSESTIKTGYQLLSAQVQQIQATGIFEYDSPRSYYGVDLGNLAYGLKYISNQLVRQQLKLLFDYFWADICGNFFPAKNTISGPHSRDYTFIQPGPGGTTYWLYLYGLTGQIMAPPGLADAVALYVASYYNVYTPNPTTTAMATSLPKTVISNWGPSAGMDRYNYVTPTFTIGGASHDYCSYDKNILIQFADAYKGIDLCVIPDDTNQPYGLIDVGSKPYHLPLRPACVQYQSQLLATLIVKANPGNLTKSCATNIILPLNATDIAVNGTSVLATLKANVLSSHSLTLANLQAGAIPIDNNAVVSVINAQGNAMALFRIFYATGFAGDPMEGVAQIFLFVDSIGNANGVVRLAVYHFLASHNDHASYSANLAFIADAYPISGPSDVAAAVAAFSGATVSTAIDGSNNWSVSAACRGNTLSLSRNITTAQSLDTGYNPSAETYGFDRSGLTAKTVNSTSVLPSPPTNNLTINGTPYTLSLLQVASNTSAYTFRVLLNATDPGGSTGYGQQQPLQCGSTGGVLALYWDSTSSPTAGAWTHATLNSTTTGQFSDLTAGAWTQLDVAWDGSAVYLYRDGSLQVTIPGVASLLPLTGNFLISNYLENYGFAGSIASVQASTVARSAAWLGAMYAAESAPAAFWAWGSEQAV